MPTLTPHTDSPAAGAETAERITPLKIVREAQGRTQVDVAAAARVAPEQLSRAERGLGGLSIESLYRLAVALHMDTLATSLRPYVRPDALEDL